VEVGRHLIQQDEDGPVTLKELQPVLFIRRLWARSPEGSELIPLAKLVGDFPPEVVVGTVPTVQGCDVSRIERDCVQIPTAVHLAKVLVPSQQPKPHQEVGLAAPHGLLQVKHCLR
jgi:hypothetical protein